MRSVSQDISSKYSHNKYWGDIKLTRTARFFPDETAALCEDSGLLDAQTYSLPLRVGDDSRSGGGV